MLVGMTAPAIGTGMWKNNNGGDVILHSACPVYDTSTHRGCSMVVIVMETLGVVGCNFYSACVLSMTPPHTGVPMVGIFVHYVMETLGLVVTVELQKIGS